MDVPLAQLTKILKGGQELKLVKYEMKKEVLRWILHQESLEQPVSTNLEKAHAMGRFLHS